MTKEKNKSKLEEEIKVDRASRIDFEEALELSLNQVMENYNRLILKYNRYIKDKERYHIKYWRTKQHLFYTRHTKEKIGFKTPNPKQNINTKIENGENKE